MSDHPPDVCQCRDAALPPADAANYSPLQIGETDPMAHSGAPEDPNAGGSLQNDKWNPTAHSGAPAEIDTDSASQNDKSNPTAHSGALAGSDDGADDPSDKSNPMAHSGARERPLSHRQLAAARLLARGHGTMRVAQRLGVNRHTIARWKRDPRFAAELGRLVASLRESALRLRAGSTNHAYFSYLAMLRGTSVGE